jgi:hypothetical protein
MKRGLCGALAGAALLSGCATQTYDSMGPALALMSQQQKCYLIARTASAAATWRDDGVSVRDAHARLDTVITPMRAPDDYKAKLHEGIDSTYQSRVTAQQLFASMKSVCRTESARVPAVN